MTWSTVIRGTKLGEEIVECGELSYRNRRVSFAVASCSRYASRTHASVREMEDIAWILRSDPHRNQVGFVRSARPADEERCVLEKD